jgi:diaminohydroxyphosphoribosylaminopyrimidine deaminase/5-amino-6-(5-phosphoribosylamino)uracil reductase
MKQSAITDAKFMREALALARRGEGLTRPNPPVGAVVVKNGWTIGRGWHRKAGGPHAEIYALRQAGTNARGATLYVTLEPCSTTGRTPPCTEAILAAGIRRVVFALKDPNPRHAGRAAGLLRRAGIEVCAGVEQDAARELLQPFTQWITTGHPWVTLKLAQTLDGRIADAGGTSRWISSAVARGWVQDLRRRSDGILVGAGTVIADNPSLLPRPDRGRQPWRMVVDSRGRCPRTARIFSDDAAGRTILATTRCCSNAHRLALERRGVSVWILPATRQGRVDLHALSARLGRAGLLRVLCEGGGELAGEWLRVNRVDEMILFVAPKILGGTGIPAISGAGWRLAAAPAWRWSRIQRVGDDLMMRLVRGS